MTGAILLFLAIVCAVELLRRLQVIASFRRLAVTSHRTQRMLRRRRVSEHWKERCMQMLSRRMFTESIKAGGYLLVVAAPIALVLLLDGPLGLGTMTALFDFMLRLYILAAVILYVIFRSQIGRRLQRR